MKLILDIGNSFIKVVLFYKNSIHKKYRIPSKKIMEIFALEDIHKCSKAIISSVISTPPSFKEKLNREIKQVLLLNANMTLPFTINYRSKDTLGKDRIALCAGASLKYPKQNCLIIDTGTCITYDILSKEAIYEGGAISPGMDIRYKALHHFTSKLPLIEFSPDFHITGKTTEDSIRSGVQYGIIKEVEGYITYYQSKYKALKIIIAGGDFDFLSENIKCRIFAEPDLILYGLNEILENNS
jgi:type III pantothenate kinase